MFDDKETQGGESRAIAAVFQDLRCLVHSAGALHEISSLIYRDLITTVDMHEARVISDSGHRWSHSKLNHNELLLLLGLLVQSSDDHIITALPPADGMFASRADSLFSELHHRLFSDFMPEPGNMESVIANSSRDELIGSYAREAIYYGPDSFYMHQFANFSRKRYKPDMEWLLQNAKISIRPMIDIAQFIVNHINGQITRVSELRSLGYNFSKNDLTDSLLIAKDQIQEKFGRKSEAFFAKFVTPAMHSNTSFIDPFAINSVSISPIIEIGPYLYVPIQYRLLESIYESPFFWMMKDNEYKNQHAKHRGDFLEDTSADILCGIFGVENVHRNVVVARSAGQRGGEIDVLVSFGEFLLVVQAKSKRITLKAKAGDTEALEKDFKEAIQNPYRQALECIELIRTGSKCIDKNGRELELHPLPRFFPVVVLSDSFPASTILSRQMLQRGEKMAPVIWDIGVLDSVARILPSPVEMLFFLKCRADAFDHIAADSEYAYLGFHLEAKLALSSSEDEPDPDFLMLGEEFATPVDDFMTAADVGLSPKRPKGVLERANVPIISELVREAKEVDPKVAAMVIELYNLSGKSWEKLSKQLQSLRQEVAETGKAIKAMSFLTGGGGITYAVTPRLEDRAVEAACQIGIKHKYERKQDRWYVVVDCLETEKAIDGVGSLVWAWEESEEVEQGLKQLRRKYFSTRVAMENDGRKGA